MGFWGSMFGGSNDTLKGGMKQAGQTSQTTTAQGTNLVGQSTSWLSDLMSGDPAKTAKLLAPQIKGMQDQAQQQKKTMAQFGNRSGGTNAKGQTIDDTTRSNVNNMISTLTGQAVSSAGTMGTNLLDIGMKSLGMQVDMSQQQIQNWSNSIVGTGMREATVG